MAFVRQRGNQIVIVHGEREPGTGKVRQRVLFTLYSKPEALAAIEKDRPRPECNFRLMLEHSYEDLRFDWQRIAREIEANLHVLPDQYPYREEKLRDKFRGDLIAFARQLHLADPQEDYNSAELLREHESWLREMLQLIEWRLKVLPQVKPNEWNSDNEFYWRVRRRSSQAPYEADDLASDLFEKGDFARAKPLFELLVECFPEYGEGFNFLGLIALQDGKLEEAEERFRKTIEVGRLLFPRRIARKRYWHDHRTRAYMRGLMNLSRTHMRQGRHHEALALCDRLHIECDDRETADEYRARIHLNEGRWADALAATQRADSGSYLAPFVRAFALHELRRPHDARHAFLEIAKRRPRTARMLMNKKTPPPVDFIAVSDHNAGVALCLDLEIYLDKHLARARKFFGRLAEDPAVKFALEAESKRSMPRASARTPAQGRSDNPVPGGRLN